MNNYMDVEVNLLISCSAVSIKGGGYTPGLTLSFIL